MSDEKSPADDSSFEMKRADNYRYTVEVNGADITPMAAAEAYIGSSKVRILNISEGGVAILTDTPPTNSVGDIVDVSISLRERAFPVQIEIRGIKGFRVSSSFLNPSRTFLGALREFLKPKYLGSYLLLNPALSDNKEVLALVDKSEHYEAYIGQNRTGVFVWTRGEDILLKLVAVSQDIVLEWSKKDGLKTGRLASSTAEVDPSFQEDGGIQWTKQPEASILHYFGDILLAWLGNSAKGADFVDHLVSDSEEKIPTLKFPRPVQKTS